MRSRLVCTQRPEESISLTRRLAFDASASVGGFGNGNIAASHDRSECLGCVLVVAVGELAAVADYALAVDHDGGRCDFDAEEVSHRSVGIDGDGQR